MTAAEKLKEHLTKKGITLTEVSQKTGIALDTLSKTFSGKRKLTADELVEICDAACLDLFWFNKRALPEQAQVVPPHLRVDENTVMYYPDGTVAEYCHESKSSSADQSESTPQ